MNNCWNIKNCPFMGTDPAGALCPAYACKLSCWEYDWAEFYRTMPDGAEKADWKNTMLDGCMKCEILELHREQVVSFLAKLRKM